MPSRYHNLLQRQLRRAFGAGVPVPDELRALLGLVDVAYRQADDDRDQLARSLDIMSTELVQRNEELRGQLEEQRARKRELIESETRFQAFMNNTPVLAALKRPGGTFVYANRRYEERFGHVVGRHEKGLLPVDDGNGQGAADDAILLSGRAHGEVTDLPTRSGEPGTWLVYRFPVPGATAEQTLIGIVALDITERRRIEAQLERSRALLGEAHEIARLGSWEYDATKRSARWSTELYRIYGVTPSDADLTWESVQTIITPGHAALLRTTFEHACSTREAFSFDHHFVRHDDEQEHVVHVRGRPVADPDGRVIRLVGTAQDVTERKRLEERLVQGQRLEAVGQLAAGIAHEINTPVQYVGDNLRFMQETLHQVLPVLRALPQWRDALAGAAATPDARRVATTIGEAAERLDLEFIESELPVAAAQALDGIGRIAEIVRAVKAVAHPGSGAKTLVDLNAVLEAAISVSRPEWKYVAEVTRDFDEALPPMVCLAGEMHQVFLNMLVNAAQAIAESVAASPPDERRTGRLTVSTRRVDQMVEVRIADDGVGIPPAIRERIYDPFFTTKPVGKGTGHGLALAHRIITNHGGTITFESESGRGTVFTVSLPILSEP